MTEIMLNSNSSATTGFAPFKLSGGYMLSFSRELSLDTPFKGVKQFTKQVKWNLIAAFGVIIANHMVQAVRTRSL
jgi:hypothetical protein